MGRFGLSTLLETVAVKSFRKGLLGGSRFWTTVFVARLVGRWLLRVLKKGDLPVKFSEQLAPGETLVVRHVEPS
ncbi:MAG: hypothetical protein OXB92_07055 [Acidimicrobiaceae bacterium]|nr:hypothetical protein [Acidimicrobiia bacterium]MCY4493594.1 hypothetical protein [Acidimicrobiaceae bacterium]